MALSRRNRSNPSADIWPGFVDALASLLMVIIFLLTVFVLAQFFLSDILAGRDEALKRLESNIAELTDVLALERQANAELRTTVSRLSRELQASTAARDTLALRLGEVEARAEESAADAEALREQLEAAREEVTASEEAIRLRLSEIASLQADIRALRTVREDLESKVATLADSLRSSQSEAGALRDRTKKLEAELADARERTRLAQSEIAQRDIQIEQLFGEVTEGNATVARLNSELAALRDQLSRIEAALDASEKQVAEQRVEIVSLGQRLNQALAAKVEELARYRSEFFGRLREVLSDQRDIRIVGDRFIFQSEVLFSSGDAALNPAGAGQIDRLAGTLLELMDKIPEDIDWILQVEGHTDIRPISTPLFPSNWELSTARALSVVRYLISRDVPPHRLAATGYGPYQPLDSGNDEVAYRRNRRIEFKLTQR